ncbi:MAG: hypothetical protein JW924_00760 [Fusobacteriaceae bacterium]|nr:hypothetical protein [Fusobacteriaceae bacterium]
MGKKVIQILLFVFLFTNLFADETDNFTYSKVSQKDSYEVINEKFNYYLQKGIDDANEKGKGNNKKVLYKSINKYITDKKYKDSIVRDINKDENIDLIPVKKENSIYYNWNLVNGMSLGKKGTYMAGVINFNGVQIGIDKLEHIFRAGRILFNSFDKGNSMKSVFNESYFLERWVLGGNRIGASIISYGDLSANFNGMRLWNDMLKNHPDPLGREIEPYIVYENDKWVLKNKVDLRNYIDDSLNERINPCIFSHKSSTKKFLNNVNSLKEKGLVDTFGYSENKEIFDKLILKYGEYGKYILNDK